MLGYEKKIRTQELYRIARRKGSINEADDYSTRHEHDDVGASNNKYPNKSVKKLGLQDHRYCLKDFNMWRFRQRCNG
jgi:hypothetical protein